MKITNNYNLPLPILNAVLKQRSDYSKGNADFSVTELINPPQQNMLRKIHDEEVEEDVSSMLWSLMGTAMHRILEDSDCNEIAEKRLTATFCEKKISGGMDRLLVKEGVIQDYKFCSVWEYIYGAKDEREKQLNMYVELCEQNGIPINSAELVMLFRDYSPTKAKTTRGYPEQQVAVVPVTIWPKEKRIAYIEERVRLHSSTKIIPCSDEERWASGGKVALMKKGRKSAIKLFDSEEEASSYMASIGISDMDGVHYLEHRTPKYRRCEDYCNVSNFCQQYQEETNDNV